MRSRDETLELLHNTLGMVRLSDATATYVEEHKLATRFGNNAITQNTSGAVSSISLAVAAGTRHGSSRTNRLDDEGIRDLVSRAEALAENSPEDPEYMPPVPPSEYPDIPQHYFDATAQAGPADIADGVALCIDKVRENNMEGAGTYEAAQKTFAMANSAGLELYDKRTDTEFGVTVRTSEGTGKAGAFERNITDLNVTALTEEAVRTAAMNRDQKKLYPGEYTVILTPHAVAELMEFLVWDIDDREADEGINVFAGKMGEKMFGDNITMLSPIDDPDIAPPSCGEGGISPRETLWVKNGVVQRLAHSRYWAAHKGTEPDPHAFPFRIEGEDRSFDELVAMCERGLLVNRVWYIRYVDQKELLLTGMTRDGLFLVENGRISHAVKNFRFNEFPVEMLNNVAAMSRSEKAFPHAKVPGMLVHNFTMSSTTQF
jgi:predicted Zn-dependent protease